MNKQPGPRARSMRERFEEKIATNDQHGWTDFDGVYTPCIDWTGSLSHGYGQMSKGSKTDGTVTKVKCHRVAFELEHGTIPADKQINHRCHRRCCVNWKHLYAGTPKENTADMDAAGRRRIGVRRQKGERNNCAKLNDQIVRAIRNDQRSCRAVAVTYGIHESHVYQIKKRKLWPHVT